MEGRNIPCFSCGAELPNLMEDRCGNQPGDGLEFTTPGHYGSTEFDPMDGTRLAINVCDSCLGSAREMKRVLIIRDFQYDTWEQ